MRVYIYVFGLMTLKLEILRMELRLLHDLHAAFRHFRAGRSRADHGSMLTPSESE
jgi:hypothetical protein